MLSNKGPMNMTYSFSKWQSGFLTDLGLVSHLCVMKNRYDFPSDEYMRRKYLYHTAPKMEAAVPLVKQLISLEWRHNGGNSVSNHQPHGCLLNRLFGRRSKKTSKLRVTGLCVGNSPGTGEFPAQMASYAENFSIWWRHHVNVTSCQCDQCSDSTFNLKAVLLGPFTDMV